MTKPYPKVLIVFFSRTGTTRRVAESIARGTRGELEELRECKSRRGIFGWLRSGYDGTYRRAAETLPIARDLRSYDLVFIGSPTWSRALSSPVRGFLERRGPELENVATFATCQEQGADVVLDQMAALLPNPPLARLALLEREVKGGPAVQVGALIDAALSAWDERQPKLRLA